MSLQDEAVPRTVPEGAASHSGDQITIVWAVIFGAISAAAAYYAAKIAYHDDTRLGGAAASLTSGLLSALVTWRLFVARGRRTHALRFGRAVPGTLLERTRVTVRSSHGGYMGSYFNVRIAFEDKEVLIRRVENAPENPIVYVDGRWAATYSPGERRRVEVGKWVPRREGGPAILRGEGPPA